MQRPTLNPIVYGDLEAAPLVPSRWRQCLLMPLRLLLRLLLVDIAFWGRGQRLRIEDASPASRLFLGLFYRLLFVPLALALVVAVLVYMGTHPARMVASSDPLSNGIFYSPVNFVSEDGVCLDGWFVPALEAKTILADKDQALRQTRAAVVLIHDENASRLQMLPLVQPLHAAGYVVLVTTLRGSSGNWVASTFGLKEGADVRAAVEFLSSRPGIDAKRIAVLGVGTGANAALLAAARDTRIAAVVLDHPVMSVDEMIDDHISPPQRWLKFLRPACKWAFELSCRVDAEEMDVQERLKDVGSRPVLQLQDPSTLAEAFHVRGLEQIQAFLSKSMPEPTPLDIKPVNTATVEILR